MITIRDGTVEEVHSLMILLEEFSNPYPKAELDRRLKDGSLILIAEHNGKPVGFKCGYHKKKETRTFYSWLGGVLKEKRKMGIAERLLEKMERWCKSGGYHFLEFKTLNEHRMMLLFAIKHGFCIEEVVTSKKDERKRIILRKKLN